MKRAYLAGGITAFALCCIMVIQPKVQDWMMVVFVSLVLLVAWAARK